LKLLAQYRPCKLYFAIQGKSQSVHARYIAETLHILYVILFLLLHIFAILFSVTVLFLVLFFVRCFLVPCFLVLFFILVKESRTNNYDSLFLQFFSSVGLIDMSVKSFFHSFGGMSIHDNSAQARGYI